ncbi:purine nucleoside phosphorylase-like isoform X2 [Stylophora pistillata]|uniref:Purine nucleoside phosphorylase n=2 Tax=Stylophora pistillata TaxID=50429 RepID=A0A2B4RZE0_STYPI|nr:purine nucleoside phosphorylase-like isoform X2 [Stylophora pistillata]PFX21688.1 Purine nucleoside phosphorylase [Stylophora pistillata]
MSGNPERRFEFSHEFDIVEEICNTILNQTKHRPTVGIICGTGLSSLGDIVEDKDAIPYGKIKHFPKSTVKGHIGQFVLGLLNGKTVVMMQGRTHLYEGYSVGEITLPVRVMIHLGVKTLIVTNAAGGLNRSYNVGDIMVIKDHINLAGLAGENPLRGVNDERFGPRFPALSDAYDRSLVKTAIDTATELGYSTFMQEGVYCAQVGPAFETPAECRFLSLVGADAVGMSTVHEVVVARHAGVKVLGFSLITNVAVMGYEDNASAANHQEVLETGKQRSSDMQKLVSAIVGKM